MGTMKVWVDPDLCVGHGRCYELAPEIYGEDERGHCLILQKKVSGDRAKAALLGADNCPEGAIFVEPDDDAPSDPPGRG
jgi:ferredoxin